MIKSDEELASAIHLINANIQLTADYIGPEDPDCYDEEKYLIELPKNYLSGIKEFTDMLYFISSASNRKNIAYSLQYHNFLSWMLNRTNVYGALRNMIMKSGIITMAAISETLIKTYTGRKSYVKAGIRRLRKKGIINNEQLLDLFWLWQIRQNIHLYLTNPSEYEKYSEENFNRSAKITKSLINSLKEHYGKY